MAFPQPSSNLLLCSQLPFHIFVLAMPPCVTFQFYVLNSAFLLNYQYVLLLLLLLFQLLSLLLCCCYLGILSTVYKVNYLVCVCCAVNYCCFNFITFTCCLLYACVCVVMFFFLLILFNFVYSFVCLLLFVAVYVVVCVNISKYCNSQPKINFSF